MTPGLSEVLSPAGWPLFAFVSTRVGGLTMTAPLWSMTAVPHRIRAAVAVVLTLALLPGVPHTGVPDGPVLLLAMAAEFLIGVLIGLTAAVFMHGVSFAGEIVALQMGLSAAPTFNPMTEDLVPGVGQMKSLMALMIYVSVDGHLMMIRGLAESFRTLPPGLPIVLDKAPVLAAQFLGTVYAAAIRAAAPAMVALFLVNLAVAITGRAVPQFPALMVIFPITITAGFVMISLSLPATAATVAGWMFELPGRIGHVTQILAGRP